MGTHSSLRTGTLDLDLESTRQSGVLTGRDENIHLIPDISDDDKVSFI